MRTGVDLTTGSPFRKIAVFTLPVIIGNLFQELYGVVDTLIVGKTLGVLKLAAVGATGPLLFLAMGFLMGLTSGCSVKTSHAFGAGNRPAMLRTIAVHGLISLTATVLMTVMFTAGAGPLLRLLNTPAESMAAARTYLVTIFAGTGALTLYNFASSTLRAVGDSRMPLVFLIISSVLNVMLDLVLILAFSMDVFGAALATVIAQLLSGALCVAYILRKTDLFRFERESFDIGWSDVREQLAVGVPMGIQFSVIAMGLMVLQYVLNGFGPEAIAAFTMGLRILGLCQNPQLAMSTVMATYVGQNYGARKFGRIRAGVTGALLFAVIVSSAAGGGVLLFDEQVIGFFLDLDEARTVALSKELLWWSCPFLVVMSFMFVCRGALQGIGDGVTPMAGGFLELVMRAAVPVLFGGVLGFTAVCIANPCAWTSCALVTAGVWFWKIRRKEEAWARAFGDGEPRRGEPSC